MKRKQHITAFYLETLLMIAVVISIILVLTKVFGGARVQSTRAKRLTDSVTLAQNTAEAVSLSHTPQELHDLLNEDSNAVFQEDAQSGQALVTAVYDAQMQPVPLSQEILESVGQEGGAPDLLLQRGELVVETSWVPSQESGLVDAVITVFDGNTGEAVYALETSVYPGGQE